MTVIGELAVNAVVRVDQATQGAQRFRTEVKGMNDYALRTGEGIESMVSTAGRGFSGLASFAKEAHLGWLELAAVVVEVGHHIVHQQAEVAEALDKTSRKLDTTVEELNLLRGAAQQAAHMGAEELDSALEQMQIRISQAEDGTGKAVKSLDKLGISAAYINSLPVDEKLEVIAARFEGVENPADRLRIATELFGKNAKDMMLVLQGGAEGLAEFRAEVIATGGAVSNEANESLKKYSERSMEASRAYGAFKHELGGAIAPAFTAIMKEATEWIVRIHDDLRGGNSLIDAYNAKVEAEARAHERAAAATRQHAKEIEDLAQKTLIAQRQAADKAEASAYDKSFDAMGGKSVHQRAESLHEGNETFGMSQLDATRHQLAEYRERYMASLRDPKSPTRAVAAEYEGLIKELEVREKLEEQRQRDLDAKRQDEELDKRAAKIREESLSPLEKLKAELQDIATLRDKGKLSDSEALAAAQRARDRTKFDADKPATEHHSPLGVARFDSAEAFRAIRESRRAGEKDKVPEKQLNEQKEANKLLKQIRDNAKNDAALEAAGWN